MVFQYAVVNWAWSSTHHHARSLKKEYISIIPTPDFQISHYKEREWVPHILEGCSDKQQAFHNWMERDILFAKQIKAECEENAVPCIVNDGLKRQDEMFRMVKELFHLK